MRTYNCCSLLSERARVCVLCVCDVCVFVSLEVEQFVSLSLSQDLFFD